MPSASFFPADLRGVRHVRGEHRAGADPVPPLDLQRQRQRQLLLRHQPRLRHGAGTDRPSDLFLVMGGFQFLRSCDSVSLACFDAAERTMLSIHSYQDRNFRKTNQIRPPEWIVNLLLQGLQCSLT